MTVSPTPAPCQYRIGPVLGSGSYATVREVVHIETKEYFACKVINKKLMQGRENMVMNEIRVMEKIARGHPNIVSLRDYFETTNSLYIVTDLMKGGELFDRICRKRFYLESDANALVRTILSAVEYLHGAGVVHRDLKPENLLFKNEDEDAELMVADFGLSEMIDESTRTVLKTVCGTPAYMAPEVFRKTGHGKPVDIWSIGVITYFLLCGMTPFDRETQAEEIEAVCTAAYKFEPVEFWKDISEAARDFIRSCLTINPSDRLTATTALSHSWLSAPTGPDIDLLPAIMQHASPQAKFTRSVLAVRAASALKEGGEAQRKRRVEMGEEERKVVERVEEARTESEKESDDLEWILEKAKEHEVEAEQQKKKE